MPALEFPMRHTIRLMLAIACLLPGLAGAQMRDFEDSFGRTIRAQLVSHTGASAETVLIKKADGKEFDVKISMFSEKDQAAIRKWMKATPPTIRYAFRVEGIKKKDGPSTAIYNLEVTNLARETVNGISVKTRSIYEYSYVPSIPNYYGYGGRFVGIEETFKIPAEMKFNQTASFSTSSRYNLLGVMVRVFNAAGDVITEEKMGSTKLASLNWDDGRRRKTSTSGGFGPDTGEGGSTTVTIDD